MFPMMMPMMTPLRTNTGQLIASSGGAASPVTSAPSAPSLFSNAGNTTLAESSKRLNLMA